MRGQQMTQQIELKLANYNYMHPCFEGRKKEKQLQMNSGIMAKHSVWEALEGGEEYHFSKIWQVFSLEGKKFASLAPGINQSI